MICNDIYLLLTEFEGRTVKYGPAFFPFDLWPKRFEGEKQGSVICSTDRENEVSKIFIISLYLVIERAGREVVLIQAERQKNNTVLKNTAH